MQEELLRSLVWTDYRLALIFTVLFPLILLLWAFVQKNEPMQRLLTIYWRVSSLLAITVYLMIGGLPVGFISGLLATILIPISLWFWVDLNDEIDDQPLKPLKLTFTSWRWAVTVYSVLGAIATVPFVRCALSREIFGLPICRVWLEAPLIYKDFFHAGSTPGFLGFFGIVGLIVYVLCLIYFVAVRLGKQGRSAVQQ